MNYTLKEIKAEELHFNLNLGINFTGKLDLKPTFERQVSEVTSNKLIKIIRLSVSIKSTADAPKPFDIKVTLGGVFELETEAPNEAEKRKFVIEATDMMYTYIRTAVTNLTAQAYIPPINLPVLQDHIFPEDRN